MASSSRRQLAFYFAGSIANNALSFILLPLYLRHLSPAEFGVVSVLTTLNVVVGTLATAGILSGLTRLYYEQEEQQRKAMVGTVIIWVAGISALVGMLLLLTAAPLSRLLFKDAAHPATVRVAILLLATTGFQYTLLSILRLNMRAAGFVVVSLTGLLLDAGLKVYFIVVERKGAEGYFLAALISTAVTVALALGASWRDIRWVLDLSYLRRLLALGAPFILTAFLMWALDLSDNLLLNAITGPVSVAIYSLAYKVATIFRVLMLAPLSLFWNPFFFDFGASHGPEELRRLLSRSFELLGLAGVIGIVGVSAGSADLIRLLDGRDLYRQSAALVPFLLLAPFLYALSFPAGTAILYAKEVRYTVYAMAGGVALNVGLNLLLIPRFSFYGTTAGTVGGYSLYFLLISRYGQRCFPVRYDWARLLKLTACGAIAVATSTAIPVWGSLPSLLLHELTGFGVFMLVALLVGAARWEDFRELRRLMQGLQLRSQQPARS